MSHADQHNTQVGYGRDTRKDRLEFNKLRKRLRRQTGKAIAEVAYAGADQLEAAIAGAAGTAVHHLWHRCAATGPPLLEARG